MKKLRRMSEDRTMKVQVLLITVVEVSPQDAGKLKTPGHAAYDTLLKRLKWKLGTRWVRIVSVTDTLSLIPPKGEPELEKPSPRLPFDTDAATVPVRPAPGPRAPRPTRKRKSL